MKKILERIGKKQKGREKAGSYPRLGKGWNN